jgi:glycosyltransferase involved in cell wall biosynthesis
MHPSTYSGPLPLVSLCVAAYNYERYVEQAVGSLAHQSYPNVEIIVLNNASDDRTGEICERLASEDSRIQLVHNTATTPPADSHNKLLHMARGDYLAIASADDVYYPTKIERQVEALEAHPAWGACFSLVDYIDANTKSIAGLRPAFTLPKDPHQIRADLMTANAVCMPSNLLRRTVVDAIGEFDGAFPRAFDYEYWMRMVSRYDIGMVPEPLMAYRLHGKNADDYAREQIHRDTWKAIVRHAPEIARRYPAVRLGPGQMEDNLASLALGTRDWPEVETFVHRKIAATRQVNERDALRMSLSLLKQGRPDDAQVFLEKLMLPRSSQTSP